MKSLECTYCKFELIAIEDVSVNGKYRATCRLCSAVYSVSVNQDTDDLHIVKRIIPPYWHIENGHRVGLYNPSVYLNDGYDAMENMYSDSTTSADQ
jgi:hypothetical protein